MYEHQELKGKIMKKLLAVLVVVCAIVNLGCEPPSAGMQDQPRISGPSKPDDAAKFPEIMVGVWETKRDRHTGKKWGIRFERDGSVQKIIHYLAGPVNLAEGGALIEGADPEQEYALFVMGPCPSKYDTETGIVEVDIVVESYTIKKPTYTLTGHMTDRFTGVVSKNGKTWTAERRTYAVLDGAKSLSDEFADAHPDTVIFYKQDILGTE